MASSIVKLETDKVFFHKGDTFTTNFVWGYVANNGQTITVNAMLPKIRWHVSGVEIASSTFTISLRHYKGGYAGGSANYDVSGSGITKNLWFHSRFVRIQLSRSSGWGVTNNTPVVGTMNVTLRFT